MTPPFRPKTEKIFEEILRDSVTRTSGLLESPSRETAHALLLTGSVSAELTAKQVMDLGRLRTKLDKPKAHQLCKLFTLDALSRYLSLLENQLQNPPPDEERVRAREEWGGMIYRLFLDDREESIGAYLSLDSQFRYDYYERQPRIEKEGGFVIYSLYDLYLLGASLFVLGGSSNVHLPSRFPVHYEDLGPFESWLDGVGLRSMDMAALRVAWLESFNPVVETLRRELQAVAESHALPRLHRAEHPTQRNGEQHAE